MKLYIHPLSQNSKGLPPGASVDRALIGRLEQSFSHLRSSEQSFATLFYDRLFAAHPELRPMFPKDIEALAQKLTITLEWVIARLKFPDLVKEELAALGRRHVGYGAKPEHYPIVRESLLGAMRETMKDQWTDELDFDWRTALDQITRHMMEAARTS